MMTESGSKGQVFGFFCFFKFIRLSVHVWAEGGGRECPAHSLLSMEPVSFPDPNQDPDLSRDQKLEA